MLVTVLSKLRMGRNHGRKLIVWLSDRFNIFMRATECKRKCVLLCVSQRQSYRQREIVEAEQKDKGAVIVKKKQGETRIQISH